LNNTKKAQDEAAVAIEKANKDTEAAGKDLAQVRKNLKQNLESLPYYLGL